MKKMLLPALLCCYSLHASAQRALTVNYSVDTLEADVRTALQFFRNYLSDFRKDSDFRAGINPAHSLPDFRRYWSPADCRDYSIPDQMVYAIASDYPTYLLGNSCTILSVVPDSSIVRIRTMFGNADSGNRYYPLAIANHYIAFDKERKPYFISPLKRNGHLWQTKEWEDILYTYPAGTSFDSSGARQLSQKVRKLRKEWGLPPIRIRYYYADSREEIDRLRGFDYTPDMTNRSKPSGISDDRDNLVYCAGWGAGYFHEVVHIYLNRLFPDSPLKEGLAAFYGGSMGHDLNWHRERLSRYLADHPEIDPADESFYYMDNYTNPQSTIQAMLCSYVYRHEGVAGLRRLMSYKTMDEIYDKAFRSPQRQRNAFLRKLIAAR